MKKIFTGLLNLKFIFLFSILFYTPQSFGQQEVFVSGQVLDKENNQGLESCAVGFYNEKSQLVTGSVTDEKGYFEMALPRGKFKMIIDYVGYKKQEIPVTIIKNNQFLGIFKLAIDNETLDAVQIKAKSHHFKVDKDVYVITRKMKVAAANTNDVLDKIKGITYDRYNNNIKVDGQTNVKILVNGLEKDADYISNLNPERIKKVEIIRDPGGRYGLEGYSAVINVILKQNYTGMEFNLSNQAVIDPDTQDKAYLMPMNALNLSYNYTYNKINFYTQYGNYSNNLSFPSSTIQTYDNAQSIKQLPYNGENNFSKKAVNDRLTLGIDYFIDPKNTLSFETGNRNLFFNNNEQERDYEVKSFSGQILDNVYKFSDLSDETGSSNYQSLFYIGNFSEKNNLHLDFTRSYYENKNKHKYLTDNMLSREEIIDNSQILWKMNAEWNHQINDKTSLQMGYGFLYKDNTNLLKTKTNGQTQFLSNDFSYSDTRHKLFAYYGKKLNQKWSLKIGAASEISRPEAFGEQTTYLIYQPYLDLKYQFNKMIDFKLKYRSESEYPGLSQANPHEIYLDENTVSKGNPYLEPSVIHKISMRSNAFGGAIYMEPYYQFSNNYIGQTGRLRSDGIFEYTYDNVGNYKHYGIRGSLAFPLSKKIFWQTNYDFYRSSIIYNGKENAFNDFSLESNLMYVNREKGLTSGLIYQRGMNKQITTQGYHKWNNDFVGFLIQKPFYKKRLNLMLLYMLPVDLGVNYVQEEYIQTNQYQRITSYDIHLLKNIFVFRLNYRFSKGKTTRKTKKDVQEDIPEKKSKELF